tara:strand:+ start:18941 stop:19120 length:180 start_codon:yes stop_codon:yes gene_type:complete
MEWIIISARIPTHTVMNAPGSQLHSRCHRDISIADNAVITLILEKRVGWNGYHTSIKTA